MGSGTRKRRQWLSGRFGDSDVRFYAFAFLIHLFTAGSPSFRSSGDVGTEVVAAVLRCYDYYLNVSGYSLCVWWGSDGSIVKHSVLGCKNATMP